MRVAQTDGGSVLHDGTPLFFSGGELLYVRVELSANRVVLFRWLGFWGRGGRCLEVECIGG